ncbi:MAG: universal stress protein [Acidobacteria bacterium]|nr:universal stress protein [Acidobacteriota bacterium]
MFKLERILCAVDFSKASAAALRVAGGLAKGARAEVTVLHVQRLEAPEYFTVAQIKALNAQLRRSLRAARKFTEDFAAKNLPRDIDRSTVVLEADPVDAILQTLKESKADLLAMGTHGRTGIARFRLGSVSESVLRQAARSVLTAGPRVQLSASLGTIRRVLCPINYSELAHRTLELAAAIAEITGAELIVTHVLEEPGETEAGRRELCDWVPSKVRNRCSVREVVRSGHPAEQTLLEAERSHADLLVIGAQHRNMFGSLLFGSTTETVIRSAACPVFSVVVKNEK